MQYYRPTHSFNFFIWLPSTEKTMIQEYMAKQYVLDYTGDPKAVADPAR